MLPAFDKKQTSSAFFEKIGREAVQNAALEHGSEAVRLVFLRFPARPESHRQLQACMYPTSQLKQNACVLSSSAERAETRGTADSNRSADQTWKYHHRLQKRILNGPSGKTRARTQRSTQAPGRGAHQKRTAFSIMASSSSAAQTLHKLQKFSIGSKKEVTETGRQH